MSRRRRRKPPKPPTFRALGRALLAVVVTALGLTACGAPGSSEPGTSDLTALEGGSWVLESGTVDGEAVEVPDSPAVTLTIAREDGAARISGRVCNSFGGELAGWPDAVAIEDLFSTEMACEVPGLMDLESLVLGALPRVSAITGDLADLTTTGDGVELVWTASAPTAEGEVAPDEATDLTSLEGGSWSLVSGTVDGVALAPVPGRDSTLTIRRDGELVTIGATVCNSLGGTLVGWPDTVEISEIAGTAMLCEPEALMTLEEAVTAALPRVTAIVGDADGVTLTGDGVEIVYTGRPAADLAGITDVTWTMQSLTLADGTVLTPVEPSTVWVLGSDGTQQATSGCLTFTGGWRTDGYDVVFGDSRQDGECEDAEMAAAGEALAALGDGFTPSLDGGTLTTTSRFGVVATSIEATG